MGVGGQKMKRSTRGKLSDIDREEENGESTSLLRKEKVDDTNTTRISWLES